MLTYSGTFKIGGTNLYGTNGLIIAAFLILVLALVGAFNPSVSIVLAIIGLIASFAIGFVEMSLLSLVGIIIVAGIIILKSKS
jgi:hypothetical protein